MKNTTKKRLALVTWLAGTMLVAQTALALDSQWGTIYSVRVWLGSVDVYFVDNSNTHSCGGTTSTKFNLPASAGNYEQMYSALLAGYLSGKEVQVRYECSGADALIDGVRLRK